MILELVAIWLKRSWSWLKKYWKWLLFPVGIALYVVGRLAGSRGRPVEVASPALTEAEKVRQEATSKADSEKAEAARGRDEEIRGIEAEHAQTLAKLTREQRDEMEELQGDPEALNAFLIGVGKELRQ